MLFALLVSSVASNLIGTLHPSHLSQYKNKLTTAAGLADIYYLTQFDTGKYIDNSLREGYYLVGKLL